MTKCNCGDCPYCRTRACKTAWQRQKRGGLKRVPYTCTCGRANKNGTCKACWTQLRRTGSTERKRPTRRYVLFCGELTRLQERAALLEAQLRTMPGAELWARLS